MEQQIKQVPYGVADFANVMEQNLYYVDKTMFIPELEKLPRNLFFIRPRRFGKSIFLSMLYSYYDCAQSKDFQNLFGTLWIGQHPTALQGKYQVLFLDFSQITGNIDKLEDKFNSYLSINLDAFVRQYSEFYQAEKDEIFAQEDFEEKMELIFKAAKAHKYPLYLIIDEYDNFTNVILNERGEKVYHAITHADGFYRDVFKKFKGNFERIFMMGVSPVTLDDVTSRFNIGWNISIKPEKLILGIPNNNVRKQYYGYLEEEYQAKAYVDTNRLTDYYYDMAYDGKWEEGLQFMADAYAKVSSVRDGIEAERNLQGFFMAYLNLNDYYITAPELELSHGYCDFFLLPDLTHYASKHSYILELKVLSKKEFSSIVEGETMEDGTPMTKGEKQWREAVEQIHRYAEAPRVEALRQGTRLHLIIMQFEGWELKRMQEV